MTMKKKQPQNLSLDKEEQLIEEALEKGSFTSVSNLDELKIAFKEAAKQFKELKKSKRITIRINQLDLLKVKAKALKNQIPYQTLLGSLIHQYAEGQTKLSL